MTLNFYSSQKKIIYTKRNTYKHLYIAKAAYKFHNIEHKNHDLWHTRNTYNHTNKHTGRKSETKDLFTSGTDGSPWGSSPKYLPFSYSTPLFMLAFASALSAMVLVLMK